MTLEGEPWFVARDVCEVLGFAKNPCNRSYGNHLARLEKSEVRVHLLATTRLGRVAHRKQQIVSESGLYKLIMRSDKPQAKAFQDWVTKEVLPPRGLSQLHSTQVRNLNEVVIHLYVPLQ